MSIRDDVEKVQKQLRQEIVALVRKVNSVPGCAFSGFIYGYGEESKEPYLFHIGNVQVTGDDLVDLHYHLSVWASSLRATGNYKRTEINVDPKAPDSQSIADKLALMLITGNSEGVTNLAKEYLESRRQPEEKP